MVKSFIKEEIVKEINELSPELLNELALFIDFLKMKENKKIERDEYLLLQQNNLSKIWDHKDEDLYDL